MECIFCKIIAGEIPSDSIYKDEEFIAFRDIQPQAPVHILIVPVKHIVSVNDLGEKDTSMIGRFILLARRIAEQEHVAESGYRLVINCGSEGGQVVPHLHLHLIGGTRLNDRMG